MRMNISILEKLKEAKQILKIFNKKYEQVKLKQQVLKELILNKNEATHLEAGTS